MSIVSFIAGSAKSWIFQDLARFSSIVLFVSGFSLVAANALVSQPGKHPAPIWQSIFMLESQTHIVGSIQKPSLFVQAHQNQQSRSTNIPLPAEKPIRAKHHAAQLALVREVQASLADLGIYIGEVDGIFGDKTRQAISLYQRKAGLTFDGEVSYGLLAKIKSESAIARVKKNRQSPADLLQLAQSGLIMLDSNTIEAVQRGLRDSYGEDMIAVDGIMGKQTRNAIRKFQKRFRIKVNGEIDRETLEKLHETGIVESF